MLKEILLTAAHSKPVREYVTQGKLMQGLVNRFIAGETLEQGINVTANLNRVGKSVTLDYVGEEVTSVEEASRSRDEYLNILDAITKGELNANVSLKLTHLGLNIGSETAEENLKIIVDRAAGMNIFVRIDMESSAYTQKTLDIFYKLHTQFPNLGVVIQASLYRSRDDIANLIEYQAKVRLCKGAYREPGDTAFPRKKEVDSNYKYLMEELLRWGNYPAIATHDESLINHAKYFSEVAGRDQKEFEFQMLHGIKRDLQDQLVSEGYNMRIYVPYGKEWYPYFVRRLLERPANLFFFLRNL